MPWPDGPVDKRTKLDALAPPDDSTKLDASTKRHGLMPKLSGNPNEFVNGAGGFGTPGSTGTLVVVDSMFSITDDVAPGKVAMFQCSGITNGATRVFVFPDFNGTLATIDNAQTFSALQTFLDTTIVIADNTTPTKIAAFQCVGLTAGTHTYSFPPSTAASTVTLAALELIQTWTAVQTFDDAGGTPIIVTDSGGVFQPAIRFDYNGMPAPSSLTLRTGVGTTGTATLPSETYTIAGLQLAQTWTALQKFPDDKLNIVGSADPTKIARFEVDGLSVGTRTFTLPDADTTLAGLSVAQTFTALNTFDRIVIDNATASDVLLKLFPHASQSANVISVENASAVEVFSVSVAGLTKAAGIQLLDSAVTGFTTEIAPSGTWTQDQVVTIPAITDAGATGTMVLASDSVLDFNVLLNTATTLRSSTASSGASFRDTTTSTKRLRFVLSGAVGNNNIVISSTAARTYTFPDVSATMLTDSTGIARLGSATIDMQTAATTTIFTTQAGKVTRITHAVVRDATASLAGGTSYTITGLRATFSLAALTTANTGLIVVRAADLTEQIEVAASTAVQLTVTTGSTAAANATIDVFGYAV